MVKLQQVEYPNGCAAWSVLFGRWDTSLGFVDRRGDEYVPSAGKKAYGTLREAAAAQINLRLRRLDRERAEIERALREVENGDIAIFPPKDDPQGGAR
jgi:hypothetical protein